MPYLSTTRKGYFINSRAFDLYAKTSKKYHQKKTMKNAISMLVPILLILFPIIARILPIILAMIFAQGGNKLEIK